MQFCARGKCDFQKRAFFIINSGTSSITNLFMSCPKTLSASHFRCLYDQTQKRIQRQRRATNDTEKQRKCNNRVPKKCPWKKHVDIMNTSMSKYGSCYSNHCLRHSPTTGTNMQTRQPKSTVHLNNSLETVGNIKHTMSTPTC